MAEVVAGGHRRGVVAGGHPRTVEAAVQVLAAGGNAFDAAVAAGFAAAVAEPCLSSLAGGGFLLAQPAGADPVLYDFFVDTPGRGLPSVVDPALVPVTIRFPGADQVFHVGEASVAVPGCLAGYLHVHAARGRLPLAEVVAPARHLARAGVELGADQASIVRLLEPIFARTAEARAMFAPPGRRFADDEVVRNPQLADLLAAIASGEVTGFGDPELAPVLAAANQAGGGVLTAEDLTGYRVVERTPLLLRHAGADVLTNPVPSFGGTLIARGLALLAEEGPAGAPASLERLEQLARVLADVTAEHVGVGVHLTEPAPPRPRASKGTTHVSVADADGNLAAMTTSNGTGSGITLGDTGVLANNIMGEADLHPAGFHRAPAGMRVGSMMAPSIVRRPDAPTLVLGSGGSERIRSALTQVLVGVLDDRLPLAEAILAPRIHWDGTALQVEPGFDAQVLDALETRWPINRWTVQDLYFGGVHAVSTDGAGVGDPRRGGCVATVEARRS
ncbi:MAG: gamma-glutamyltransferase [Nitriliruptoraceae bacterium]